MYIQEKYLDNRSLVVMKAHHTFADGHGLISLFAHMNSKFDPLNLPPVPKISTLNLIIVAILFPYLSIDALWRNFRARQPIENHSMKSVDFSKKLNIYETKEFDFNKLKFFKSLDENVTFNHFVFAVVG